MRNKSFLKRQKRTRSVLWKNIKRPRLTVFRSNMHIYAQIIDNKEGKTYVSTSDIKLVKDGSKKITKNEASFLVGEAIAKLAIKKGIKEVVFDRGGYRYHGRVKELSQGARKGGLIF